MNFLKKKAKKENNKAEDKKVEEVEEYYPFPRTKEEFKADFLRRVKKTKTTRWVRFGIVSLIFLLWVAWLGNWWVALFIFLLFDIYITGYIPFTWWKRSKNKITRKVMSWVDAIIYALILVYFVFAFIGQNYQIPSSSLEKTLLVGDYLVVNKVAYGPRVPMTPVHFPLVQNTLPILNCKSYLDWPQFKYHRLAGLGKVERGDIVVFNFPAGDTVATKIPYPDYYTLVEQYGHDVVNNDKATFGKIIYRPVDRRDNYVKRAVGLPGEKLKIVDGVIYVNGRALPFPEKAQFNYLVQVKDNDITDSEWDALGVSYSDRHALMVGPQNVDYLRLNEFNIPEGGYIPTIYDIPLTNEMLATLKNNPKVFKIMRVPAFPGQDPLFPKGVAEKWTRADYGEIWIPKKGATIKLTPETWTIYNRCIKNYEGNDDAHLGADGKVYINNKPVDKYTFQMDYYFMMGDNRDNSADSRYWGFVPEDHIVGRPEFILISFDKEKGGVRWDRIFKNANPDKKLFTF